MDKKNYDFMEVTKNEKGIVRTVVTGYVCNGEKTKISEREANGKKILNLVLKIDGKLGAKLDSVNGEYDKSKNYADPCFVRVSVWDEKKFNVLKMAQNIILAGNLSKEHYTKDGKEMEYISMNVGEYDSLKVLRFKPQDSTKPDDFESNSKPVDDPEMPF